jgi:hypothetical protein
MKEYKPEKSKEEGLIIPEFYSMMRDLIEKDYKIKRFPNYNSTFKGKSIEILNSVISDIHCGKENEWYDPSQNKNIITYNDEIRKRFEQHYLLSFLRLLGLWKNGYYFEKLNIILDGDIIDNDRIFAGQNTRITMPVGQQVWGIATELVDMINILSGYFPEIDVIGIVGNHARSTFNAKEEEPIQNNFEYTLYKIMELMFQKIDNKKIKVIVPDSRFYSIENYNYRIFLSHGDTIKGYTISYAEKKAKELLINLPNGYNLYVIGHRHHADRIGLSPEAEMLINGCWIPYDDYAYKLYGTCTQPSQWLFGSSKHRVISSLCVPIDFRGV